MHCSSHPVCIAVVLPFVSQPCCSIVSEAIGDGLRDPKNATAYGLKEVSTGPFVPIVLTNLGDDGAAKWPNCQYKFVAVRYKHT